MPERNTYRDGKVHVLSEKCSTCIFRSGNLMHLAPGRVRSMVVTAIAEDSAITCHKTLDMENQAVCRGFFDAYSDRTLPLRQAIEMNLIEEDTL